MAKRKGNKKLPLPVAIAVLVFLVISGIFEMTGTWDKLDSLITGDPQVASANLSDGATAATVRFIDVGQGDCTLFISNGKTMLIDSGEAEYADNVLDALSTYGVTQLDYAVATHAHSDHMGSMADIIDTVPTMNVIISRPSEDSASTATYTNFLDSVESSGAELIVAEPGYTFTLGYTNCRVLSPFNLYSSEENNNSIVMHITAGTTSFLMTGDAESAVEYELISAYDDISATVLKVGHHGSNTSSCEEFLAAVNPETAVIQVGEDNSYGHPTEKVLTRLSDYADNIYRTDKNGTVTFTCYSDGYTVSTQR